MAQKLYVRQAQRNDRSGYTRQRQQHTANDR